MVLAFAPPPDNDLGLLVRFAVAWQLTGTWRTQLPAGFALSAMWNDSGLTPSLLDSHDATFVIESDRSIGAVGPSLGTAAVARLFVEGVGRLAPNGSDFLRAHANLGFSCPSRT